MKRWTGIVIGAWVVLFLAFDAAVKLLGLDVAVEGTTRLGYPASLVVTIGWVELVCLLAYVIPRSAPIGALLLTGYLGGATATHRCGSRILGSCFPSGSVSCFGERCGSGILASAQSSSGHQSIVKTTSRRSWLGPCRVLHDRCEHAVYRRPGVFHL